MSSSAKPTCPSPLRLFAQAALAAWLIASLTAFTRPEPTSLWRAILFAASFIALRGLGQNFVTAFAFQWASRLAAPIALAASLIATYVAAPYTIDGKEALWLAIALVASLELLTVALRAAGKARDGASWELIRWLLVAGAAIAVYQAFYQSLAIGDPGSATTLTLADVAAQWRVGSFPGWVAQSAYGAIAGVTPVRTAPLLPHLGGLIDLLSCHVLTPSGLKNAVVATIGLLTTFSAYFSLRVLTPGRPWLAAFLAILWTISPGVLATGFFGDSSLSAAALIFVPVCIVALWVVWTRDSPVARVALSAGLAGAWAGHAAVAAWLVLPAAGIVLARALRGPPERLRLLATSAVSFLLLGAYPLLSRVFLERPTTTPVEKALFILYNLTHAAGPLFEALRVNTLPTDLFQPGLAAMALFVLALPVLLVRRTRGGWIFPVLSLAIAFLLLPLPKVSDLVWMHLPNAFLAVEQQWPALDCAALWGFCLIASFALAMDSLGQTRRLLALAASTIAVTAALWFSLRQVPQLTDRLGATQSTEAETAHATNPLSVILPASAYAWLPEPSPSATGHPIDPELENRLLDRASLAPFLANADVATPLTRANRAGFPARLLQAGALGAVPAVGVDHYVVRQPLNVPAGSAAAVRIEFGEIPIAGTMSLIGEDLAITYPLPASPNAVAARHLVIPLGRQPRARSVAIAFALTGQDTSAALAPTRYWLYTYVPTDLPVSVYSLMPYKADVNSPIPAWLETNRVWLPGYSARVDGTDAPVQRSPRGYTAVAVPSGKSKVRLAYSPPFAVAASYWLGLAAWLLALGLGLRLGLGRTQSLG